MIEPLEIDLSPYKARIVQAAKETELPVEAVERMFEYFLLQGIDVDRLKIGKQTLRDFNLGEK